VSSLTLVLQFGGASGSGYMTQEEMEASTAELKNHGRFEKGVYRRNDDQEGKRNRQSEVDPGGHSGRGPHLAVDDENAVFLHFHFREPSLQLTRAAPMRGRASAVEQTCFSQDERAGGR